MRFWVCLFFFGRFIIQLEHSVSRHPRTVRPWHCNGSCCGACETTATSSPHQDFFRNGERETHHERMNKYTPYTFRKDRYLNICDIGLYLDNLRQNCMVIKSQVLSHRNTSIFETNQNSQKKSPTIIVWPFLTCFDPRSSPRVLGKHRTTKCGPTSELGDRVTWHGGPTALHLGDL